jgi:RNA polymerase sigma-70 factor (ECF subfamily)
VEPLRAATLALSFDDASLVERVQSDDKAAFTALYRRHARYVAGVVYQLLGDDGELEDVVQETFVDAKNGLPDIDDPGAIRRWLVVIAIRRVHRLLARRRLRRWYMWKIAEVSPRASDPREARSAEDLYDVLDRIPARLRVPWILVRIGAMALDEVATVCEVSVATVKRRIAEADQRIERKLVE